MKPLRILLAEPHQTLRRLLTDFLRCQPGVEVVGELANGPDMVGQVDILRPDLVMIDLGLPATEDYEAAREIKRRFPETKVVILSSHRSEAYRNAALDSRADGYIEMDSMKQGLEVLLSATMAGRTPSLATA